MYQSSLLVALLATCLVQMARAQDILRQQRNPNPNQNNQIANIQLPPQLAALTPEQLRQLAQLREIQLQQEAAQRQNQMSTSNLQPQSQSQPQPPQMGLSPSPTNQPAVHNSGQIPQPDTLSETNDRHDDGTYNESGSEMEGVLQQPSSGSPAASSEPAPAGGAAQAAGAPNFEVNWNKCPQLEPSEGEKNKKTQVITKCLQAAPIPTNLTRENVETHREQIATCALKVEGWFDEAGNYKYDKAESEIRTKKLDPSIEIQVLKFHVACKDEAAKKFPRDQNRLIDQVQFYQACMDYYISIVCEIEVSVDQ